MNLCLKCNIAFERQAKECDICGSILTRVQRNPVMEVSEEGTLDNGGGPVESDKEPLLASKKIFVLSIFTILALGGSLIVAQTQNSRPSAVSTTPTQRIQPAESDYQGPFSVLIEGPKEVVKGETTTYKITTRPWTQAQCEVFRLAGGQLSKIEDVIISRGVATGEIRWLWNDSPLKTKGIYVECSNSKYSVDATQFVVGYD